MFKLLKLFKLFAALLLGLPGALCWPDLRACEVNVESDWKTDPVTSSCVCVEGPGQDSYLCNSEPPPPALPPAPPSSPPNAPPLAPPPSSPPNAPPLALDFSSDSSDGLRITTQFQFRALSVTPDTQHILIAGYSTSMSPKWALFYSNDGLREHIEKVPDMPTPDLTNGRTDKTILSVCLSEDTAKLVVAGVWEDTTEKRVHVLMRSADRGVSWDRIDSNLPTPPSPATQYGYPKVTCNKDITTLILHASLHSSYQRAGGLFYSKDSGETWTEVKLSANHLDSPPLFDFTVRDRLSPKVTADSSGQYALMSLGGGDAMDSQSNPSVCHGLWVTNDYGATWTLKVSTDIDGRGSDGCLSRNNAVSPNGQHMMACAGWNNQNTEQPDCFVSHDFGESFTKLNGDRAGSGQSGAISDTGTMVIGITQGKGVNVPHPAQGTPNNYMGLWTSTDNGDTWTRALNYYKSDHAFVFRSWGGLMTPSSGEGTGRLSWWSGPMYMTDTFFIGSDNGFSWTMRAGEDYKGCPVMAANPYYCGQDCRDATIAEHGSCMDCLECEAVSMA